MNTKALARQYGKPVQEQNAEVQYLFTLEGVEALLAAEREAILQTSADNWFKTQWAYDDAIRARGGKNDQP